MLYLKEANFDDIEKEWLFVRNMPENENGLTNDWPNISKDDFESKALPEMLNFSKGVDIPDWMVPETFYFLWDDDIIVGQFRIRHHLCESLRTGGGHIGYYIGKEYRQNGYGTEGLRRTLEIAKDIVPEEEFYLRLEKSNIASLKVMEKNGGRIVSSDDEHYYVRIPNPGKDNSIKD